MAHAAKTVADPILSPGTPAIKVVSHSMLFYWWPVWVVGFLMALLTLFSGTHLAIVPEGTKAKASGDGTVVLSFPGKATASLEEAEKASDKEAFPIHVAENKNYGVVFTMVLILVILITNVPLRGLWSVVALMVIVMVTLLFAFLDWWGAILEAVGKLHIYISAAGYLITAGVLFLCWAAVVFIYDQRRFMIFTPGQFIVHKEVGDMRQVYDTTNVTVEKRRSDLFRNWILGFGSGDLIVQTTSGQSVQIILPNVLNAARKVSEIADLMKTRPVVRE